MPDERDPNSPEMSFRGYRLNRYAARGYLEAVRVIDQIIKRGLTYSTRRYEPDKLTLEIIDALARAGVLALVQAGIDAENAATERERAARKVRKQQREVTSGPPTGVIKMPCGEVLADRDADVAGHLGRCRVCRERAAPLDPVQRAGKIRTP